MPKALLFLLVFLACTALCAAAVAAGKRPVEAWSYYHFDGSAFSAGPALDGSAFVAVRDNVRPVILTSPAAQITPAVLPAGSGVLAGICYRQSSGGKLGNTGGFTPYPGVPLLISSGGTQFVTVQTDDHGYFLAVLPVGTYSVNSGHFTAEITVERGRTTLIPLRTGKRMVD